jgi:ribosomal protein S20
MVMNKTKRNKKLIKQNLRNRMRNRRAKNMVAPLLKTFFLFSTSYSEKKTDEKYKKSLFEAFNRLNSHLDKLAQKKIFSKNKVARKKSTIHKHFFSLFHS